MQATDKMPDLDGLKLFDSCVSLGRVVHSHHPESFETADDLIAMMDRFHIAEALAHDHHARLVYPREDGNRRLLEAIEGQDRLHPVWVIEPPKTPGRKAAEALVEEMLGAGVKAARLPMKMIPPLPWVWDDLCAVLEEHRIPCFLDFGDVSTRGAMGDSDVNCVRDIALAHPELPLVLSHVMGGLGVHPAVVHLMGRTGNVCLDICGILEYWRDAARDVGPDRVLFATGAPFTDSGILISNIQYAVGFDAEAKTAMCGENLRVLMEAVK